MTTETMREAVARAIFEQEGYYSGEDDDPFRRLPWEEAVADEYPVLAAKAYDMADAAIRTVLERLREPTSAMEQAFYRSHCGPSASPSPDECWQAMLDAAAREVG